MFVFLILVISPKDNLEGGYSKEIVKIKIKDKQSTIKTINNNKTINKMDE